MPPEKTAPAETKPAPKPAPMDGGTRHLKPGDEQTLERMGGGDDKPSNDTVREQGNKPAPKPAPVAAPVKENPEVAKQRAPVSPSQGRGTQEDYAKAKVAGAKLKLIALDFPLTTPNEFVVFGRGEYRYTLGDLRDLTGIRFDQSVPEVDSE